MCCNPIHKLYYYFSTPPLVCQLKLCFFTLYETIYLFIRIIVILFLNILNFCNVFAHFDCHSKEVTYYQSSTYLSAAFEIFLHVFYSPFLCKYIYKLYITQQTKSTNIPTRKMIQIILLLEYSSFL